MTRDAPTTRPETSEHKIGMVGRGEGAGHGFILQGTVVAYFLGEQYVYCHVQK
jgi:hypothetical protein